MESSIQKEIVSRYIQQIAGVFPEFGQGSAKPGWPDAVVFRTHEATTRGVGGIFQPFMETYQFSVTIGPEDDDSFGVIYVQIAIAYMHPGGGVNGVNIDRYYDKRNDCWYADRATAADLIRGRRAEKLQGAERIVAERARRAAAGISDITSLEGVNLDDVASAYAGKVGCMCGCLGDYAYAERHVDASEKFRGYAISANEVSDRKIKTRAKKIAALLASGVVGQRTDGYIYVEQGGKCWALYFVEQARQAVLNATRHAAD